MMCSFAYHRPTDETRVILCHRHGSHAGQTIFLLGRVPPRTECLPIITALEVLAGEPVTPWHPSGRREE